MTLASTLITTGHNAGTLFALGFFVALWVAVDWCFWPRTAGSLARREARRQVRADRRRAEYRRRLIESSGR